MHDIIWHLGNLRDLFIKLMPEIVKQLAASEGVDLPAPHVDQTPSMPTWKSVDYGDHSGPLSDIAGPLTPSSDYLFHA